MQHLKCLLGQLEEHSHAWTVPIGRCENVFQVLITERVVCLQELAQHQESLQKQQAESTALQAENTRLQAETAELEKKQAQSRSVLQSARTKITQQKEQIERLMAESNARQSRPPPGAGHISKGERCVLLSPWVRVWVPEWWVILHLCVWRCVWMWGNGCIPYHQTQHWMNLRVLGEEH